MFWQAIDAITNSFLTLSAVYAFVALIILISGAMTCANVFDKALVWTIAVAILVGGCWSTVFEAPHTFTLAERVRTLSGLAITIATGTYAVMLQYRYWRDHQHLVECKDADLVHRHLGNHKPGRRLAGPVH